MDKAFILVMVIWVIGLLLSLKSLYIYKTARKIDAEICEDKDLPWEEFNRIRKEKVWKPKKNATYLFITGIILLILPNGLYTLNKGFSISATISLIAMVMIVAFVWKNRW